MKTRPSTTQLAPNLDAITREYVHAAIREALADVPQPTTIEITREAPPVDTARLANEVAQGLQSQIKASREDAQRAIESAAAELRASIADLQAAVDQARQAILELDLGVQRYQSTERYALTRAQVLKAMREERP